MEKKKKILIIVGACLVLALTLFFLITGCNKKYEVSFETDVGSTLECVKVTKNETLEKPKDPVKDGYEFDGWYLDGNLYDFSTKVTKNITLKARWKKVEEEEEVVFYKVSFDTDGGNEIESLEVENGKTFLMPKNPEKKGYIFEKWQLDGEDYDFEKPVLKDITLKAIWVEETKAVITYQVSFNSDGGSKVNSQKIIEKGRANNPGSPTKKGYEFVEWQLNGKKYDFNSEVTQNITLKATWKEKNKYTVSFDSAGGSSIKSQTVYEGERATAPSNPTRSDYTFTGWTLNGSNFNFNTVINSNITLKANWNEIKKYTVTFDSNGGSSVSNQTIVEGNKVSKPKNPTEEGYTFLYWTKEVCEETEDGYGCGPVEFDFDSIITEDTTLNAVWTLTNFSITFHDEVFGGLDYTYGESYSVEDHSYLAPEKEGYNFLGWNTEEDGSGITYFFNEGLNGFTSLVSNVDLYAQWQER